LRSPERWNIARCFSTFETSAFLMSGSSRKLKIETVLVLIAKRSGFFTMYWISGAAATSVEKTMAKMSPKNRRVSPSPFRFTTATSHASVKNASGKTKSRYEK
jgi:hypothetical protein